MTEVTTLGAATNAIVAALMNRDTLLADFTRKAELASIQDHEYIPMSLYHEFCDYLEQRLGVYAFLRLGRRLGANVLATAFPPSVRTIEEAFAHLDAAHHIYCRPVVGGLETAVVPGKLTVRYTAPYNCILQEGLFYEVAIRFGAANATVTHAACRRKGADACLFEVRY